jgi:hypothetical protein
MIQVRHAAAAIALGLCETVLITHGESGRSGVGRTRNVVSPASLAGQFEQPYGPMDDPKTLFTIPVLSGDERPRPLTPAASVSAPDASPCGHGARRNCSPYRRTIAAAGSSRIPTAPRSSA